MAAAKKWYEELFMNYSGNYEKEVFTQGTLGEADFIEGEISHDKRKKILDIGCGTGRHSVELAKRGYSVTGIDLSGNMLAKANKKAADSGVKVKFLKRDARSFRFREKFDLAIMLCEGAFPLMETDEMNYQILKNAHRSLKKGGKFIFTTLNGLFPLFHSVKDFINKTDPMVRNEDNHFDLMTFRDWNKYTIVDDAGKEKTLECNERYYVPSEISWLLKSLGFRDIGIFGCKLGKYSRGDVLTTEDYEMLVTAVKG